MNKRLLAPPGTLLFLNHREMDDARKEQLEQMAFRYGRYFDSYLITEPNRHYFWCRGNRGVIGFSRIGRYLNIAGGLIAAEQDKPTLLRDLIAFADLNGLVLSFFSIGEDEVPLFRRFGFQMTKFGEELYLPLHLSLWKGKKYEWVRRQSNYVRRQNVFFEELRESEHTPVEWQEILRELQFVSKEHIATKPQNSEVPFFEGQLLPGYLFRRRLFVARADQGRGRVEGFLLCNPMENGRCWAIEMYRKRVDAVRGTIPFLMQQTIQILQHEKCRKVSLCPVPALRCEQKIPGDYPLARKALTIWYHWLSWLFDLKGIFHFKSRFRPCFNNIYICAYPKISVGSTLAYMRCIGAMKFRVSTVVRNLLVRLRNRRPLARPASLPAPSHASRLLPEATTLSVKTAKTLLERKSPSYGPYPAQTRAT